MHETGTRGSKPAWRPMLSYRADLHTRGTHPAQPPFEFEREELGPSYGYGPAFGHWEIVHAMIDVLPARPQHTRRHLLNDIRLQLDSEFLPGFIERNRGTVHTFCRTFDYTGVVLRNNP